jgi:hypothetical protein
MLAIRFHPRDDLHDGVIGKTHQVIDSSHLGHVTVSVQLHERSPTGRTKDEAFTDEVLEGTPNRLTALVMIGGQLGFGGKLAHLAVLPAKYLLTQLSRDERIGRLTCPGHLLPPALCPTEK